VADCRREQAQHRKEQQQALAFLEEVIWHFFEEKEYIVAKALIHAKAAMRDIRLADTVKLSIREVRKILETVLIPQYICDSISSGTDMRYRISPYACVVVCYRVRLLTSQMTKTSEKTADVYVCSKCNKEFDEWRVIDSLSSGRKLCCGEVNCKGDDVKDPCAEYAHALERLNAIASGDLKRGMIDWYLPEVEEKKKRKLDESTSVSAVSTEEVTVLEKKPKVEEGQKVTETAPVCLEIPWLREESRKVDKTPRRTKSPTSVSHLAARKDRSDDANEPFLEALRLLKKRT